MYTQTEYFLAYSMVFAFLVLGMLVVCIPRPRKKGFVTPEQAAKDKRAKMGKKTQDKSRKKMAKAKKLKAKSNAKKIKQRQ